MVRLMVLFQGFKIIVTILLSIQDEPLDYLTLQKSFQVNEDEPSVIIAIRHVYAMFCGITGCFSLFYLIIPIFAVRPDKRDCIRGHIQCIKSLKNICYSVYGG